MNQKSARIPAHIKNQRFDILCAQIFSELSRRKIKSIIDNGGAYLNKKRIKIAGHIVNPGDRIELFWDDATAKKILSSQNVLIYEHQDFFIVNKPAGIASQSTISSSKDHLMHFLEKKDPKKFKLSEMFLVHRLDKDTSGAMIIARHKAAQNSFEQLFREKKIQKKYVCLTFFKPEKKEGVISYPIAKDSHRENCYFAVVGKGKKIAGAKEATTNYKTLEVFPSGCAYLEISPLSGRTHQIRVHLSAIGAPILGDKTYAQNVYGHDFQWICLRQMLHAQGLRFQWGSEDFTFSVQLPDDMEQILTKFKTGTNPPS